MPNAKKKGVFFAVLVLFAINILNFYDRHVPGALVEPMRREFHLSDMQIGLLGSVFIWLYAIMGVPLGRIADSGSRKKLLAWGLVVWASLTACAAIATNFSILLISRVGAGLGEARSEEHTSELQSHSGIVCRLLREKKKARMGNPG